MSLSLVLVQFLFRLGFGIALSLGITPSKLVSSGFYRVHLWVLMGLHTLAALASFSNQGVPNQGIVAGLAAALAVCCYVGAVAWLYDRASVGMLVIQLVAAGSLAGAALATQWNPATSTFGLVLAALDLAAGGLLIGTTISAMFLGHWYLNTPSMDLIPLKRLILLMGVSVIVRGLLCGIGLVLQVMATQDLTFNFWLFILFRWLSGLMGTLALAWLAWQTLKIPNTQSATGLLYAGVVLTFLGELTSQLLSVDLLYPV